MIPLLHSFEKNFERSPSYKRSFYPSLKVLLVLLGLLLTGIGFASRNSLLSPYALSVSAVTTRSCIGGSTGTITASGSGGTYSNGYSYSYSINSGSYQSSGSFTGLPAGTYTIKVRDNNNTTNVASTTATVSEYAYSTGSQTLAGSNSWVGHAYGGMTLNSSYYAGSFTESETFDENFGGNTTCFQVNANLVTSSIYTEGFSVRFRMNSTKNGLYTYDLGSDDGSRLYVDGTLVYNNWSDHSFSSSPRVLMNLSGSSSLVYEYYENSGANEVAFLNPTLILANNLTTNISQTICSGGSSALISGDSFGVLPSGLTSGVYQWSYSTSLGGARTNLASGTGATFKPDLTKAPFNSPGTYYVYRSASVTSSNNTGLASYTATNLSNAATIAIGASPAISASSTPTCVGAPYGTGTITVTATGGTTPYTYTLNGGSSQPNNTFSGLSAGTYTVAITTNSGCTASTTATVISYPNSADDQNATGSDSWIGHLYSGMNFQNYKGNFTETEQFNEGFGGDYNCFNVTSGAGTASVYTEQFSVRFKMNSSKNGLYVVDLGSDDGSRLSVDGTMVYNNWVDQPFSTKPRVLINLTGTSSLQYDFYENLQNNQVIFQNLVLVLANTLNTNTSQNVCQGSTASAISGDVYATTLPTGVSKSGTGYQWTYSTSPGGARTNITGATSAAFTPNTSAAPFNVPGTYYVYRNASLVSSNNTGYASVTATNESNPATITISPLPLTPTVTPGGSTTFCTGGNVTLASSGGTTYLWSTGATTQSINTATSGSYTVKVTNASGCQSASSAATVVTVNALPAIPTITASGSTTFCAGGSVTLTSSTGTSYIWSTGATTASISPATAGSYTVKVTNASGCQSASSAATVVTVNALPANPTASVTAQPTCTTSTGTIMVTAPSGAGITYSIDGVTYTNTTGTFTNVNPGTYNVTAKNSNGCISPATVVTVNAQPVTPVAPTVSITQPNCTTSTGTITITAPTGAGITYSIDGINYLASVTFTAINAGTYSVTAKNSNGCTSSATSAIVNPQPATPAAPMVTSPVIYCQNATASPLTAAGSNLIWGSQPPVSSSIGGTGVLSSTYFIDATYNNRLTYFTTNSPNVTITSVDYYVGSWQQVNGMVLSLFNSSGQVIATSSTITTLTAGSSPVRITNAFNFTIPTAGNYSIGLSAGLGNIGANTPGFPQTESTGSMTLTGISTGVNCFNNIQFTVNAGAAPIPSTTTPGTTSYKVTQTVNGCVSPESTITVIVNPLPSATISYAGTPYCSSSGTASPAINGTTGGTFKSDAGLKIDTTTGMVTLGASTVGTHTVTYTIAASGGCAAFSTTTNITITQQPSASGFYPASPYCSNIGTLIPTGSQTGLMGTLSSDAGLSIDPSTGVINVNASGPGLHTITYSVPAFGGCNAYSTSADITISSAPNATIKYTGTPFCSGAGTATVSKPGTGTGTFSSSAGLIIDANSGSVDLNASTPGMYTITYTVPAANGCAVYKPTTSITITPKVQTPVFALGANSGRCQGAGTVTYSATALYSTGIIYSLDAASIAGGNIINSSTGLVTYKATWSGTSTITATAAGCSPLTAAHVVTTNATPSVSATGPIVCVGGKGTITATGSGGLAPYTYSLNGGSYQSSGVFGNLALGNYTVTVQSSTGCTASTSVVLNTYPNSTDNQSTAGNNSWIGHIYNGQAFNNYIGYFPEPETFNEGFGGDATCFSVSSSSGTSSIYTEQFSVRFYMKSTKKGLYVVDLGSDDGSKLTIDGNIVYNNWIDQSFSTKPRVLINLTGSSLLNYEYYENGGANTVIFQNLTLVLANTLSINTTQGICQGNTGIAISGDSFGTLPSGLSNPKYQWAYSTTLNGTRNNIAGANTATFIPDPSVAPFNAAGTYYVYRNASVTSSNNSGVNPYTASNESNAAIITITAPPSASISYADAPFCNSISTAESVTVSGTTGGQFTATTGLTVDGTTGAIVPSLNSIGNYTVTYAVPAMGGCSSFTTTADVYIGAPGAWSGRVSTDWNNAGNWLCGQIPSSTTDAIIPQHVNNFPTVISNTAEAKDLIIRSGASLIVQGTIKVTGAVLNSGSIDVTQGSLEMNGSSAQTIAGSMFLNKMIKNLIVSNTSASGLSVSSAANDTLKISGTLSFGAASSKLYTGNNVTLVSNKSGTANVGVVGSGNSITGNVTVERFINSGTGLGQHAKSWQFLATPTSGQTVKQSWMENGSAPSNYGTQITGAGGLAGGFDLYSATPSMKYYNPQTDAWVGITNTNNAIYGQNGYMVFVRGDRTVTAFNQPANITNLRSTGTLLTGTLPPITVTPGQFQSVGNPYASAVDFTLITKDAGIDNQFYVWDPYLYGAYGLGGYQTLSSANAWKPVPGGTPSYPSGIPCSVIQSGQAFFVHSTQSMNAQMMNAFVIQSNGVTFTENCKAGASKTLNFARQAATLSGDSPQSLSVSLFTGAGESGIMADGNTVVFNSGYSENIDGNDAIKILNAGENFGIKRLGKTLAIEARPFINTTDTIFYNMSNMAQRTYQLRFEPQNMQTSGFQAFLIDKFLNASTPVSLADSSFINVTITSNAASSAADRFKVVFRQMSALPVTFVSIKATQKDKVVMVEWNVENESGMQQYEVEKSSDGNVFFQTGIVTALNKGAASYFWTDSKPFEGNNFYRVKSVSKDGKINYTKVVKVLIEKITATLSVYPNPITDGAIHLQMANQKAGVYRIKLMNSLGQVITGSKITHAENNSTETIFPGNLAKSIYQLEVMKPDGSLEIIQVLN